MVKVLSKNIWKIGFYIVSVALILSILYNYAIRQRLQVSDVNANIVNKAIPNIQQQINQFVKSDTITINHSRIDTVKVAVPTQLDTVQYALEKDGLRGKLRKALDSISVLRNMLAQVGTKIEYVTAVKPTDKPELSKNETIINRFDISDFPTYKLEVKNKENKELMFQARGAYNASSNRFLVGFGLEYRVRDFSINGVLNYGFKDADLPPFKSPISFKMGVRYNLANIYFK